MVIGIPESPRWLITQKNDLAKANETFKEMGILDVKGEIDLILQGNKSEKQNLLKNILFSSKHKKSSGSHF